MPQEAVDLAACDAAPALAFVHSLLRRPGGGRQQPALKISNKQQLVAASTAALAVVSDSAANLQPRADGTAVVASGDCWNSGANNEAAQATAGAGRRPFQQLTRLTFAAGEVGL